MKKLNRGLGLAVVSGALLGMAGCETNNETEAERLQKNLGAPPSSDVKTGAAPAPLVKSQDEYAQRYKEATKDPMKNEYAQQKKGGRGR